MKATKKKKALILSLGIADSSDLTHYNLNFLPNYMLMVMVLEIFLVCPGYIMQYLKMGVYCTVTVHPEYKRVLVWIVFASILFVRT